MAIQSNGWNPGQKVGNSPFTYGQIGAAAGTALNSMPNFYSDNTGFDHYYTGDSTQDPTARLFGDVFNGKQILNQAQNDIYNKELGELDQIRTDSASGFANTASALSDQLQFHGPSFGKRMADNLMASGKGASMGMQMGGPWGALIGGIIGGVNNIGSQLFGRHRQKKMQEYARNAYNYKMSGVNNKFSNMVDENNDNIQMNYFDMGGFPTGEYQYATKFEEGGTHEENPYGGIQAGVDPMGKPNVFEENEIVTHGDNTQDYAFSDRINVRNDVLEKFNLPNVTKKQDGNMSWADYMTKQEEGILGETPDDPISIDTFNALNDRAVQACEYQKQLEQAEAEKEQINNMSDDELIDYASQQQQMADEASQYEQMQQQAQQEQMMAQQPQMQDPMAQQQMMDPMMQQEQQMPMGYAYGGGVNYFADPGAVNYYNFNNAMYGLTNRLADEMNYATRYRNQQIYGKKYKPNFGDFATGFGLGLVNGARQLFSGYFPNQTNSEPFPISSQRTKPSVNQQINESITSTPLTQTEKNDITNNVNERVRMGYGLDFAYGGEVPYANDRMRGLDLGRNYYDNPGPVYTADMSDKIRSSLTPYFLNKDKKAINSFFYGIQDPTNEYYPYRQNIYSEYKIPYVNGYRFKPSYIENGFKNYFDAMNDKAYNRNMTYADLGYKDKDAWNEYVNGISDDDLRSMYLAASDFYNARNKTLANRLRNLANANDFAAMRAGVTDDKLGSMYHFLSNFEKIPVPTQPKLAENIVIPDDGELESHMELYDTPPRFGKSDMDELVYKEILSPNPTWPTGHTYNVGIPEEDEIPDDNQVTTPVQPVIPKSNNSVDDVITDEPVQTTPVSGIGGDFPPQRLDMGSVVFDKPRVPDNRNHYWDNVNNMYDRMLWHTAADAILPPKIDRSGLKYADDAIRQYVNQSANTIGGRQPWRYFDPAAAQAEAKSAALQNAQVIASLYGGSPAMAANSLLANANKASQVQSQIDREYFDKNLQNKLETAKFNSTIDQANQQAINAMNQVNAEINNQRAAAYQNKGNTIDNYNVQDMLNNINAKRQYYDTLGAYAKNLFNQGETDLYRKMTPQTLDYYAREAGTWNNPYTQRAWLNSLTADKRKKLDIDTLDWNTNQEYLDWVSNYPDLIWWSRQYGQQLPTRTKVK